MRFRLRRFVRRLTLALLPALALAGYAASPALFLLPCLALVPWAILYTDRREGRVSAAWYALGAYVSWLALHPQIWKYGWYAAPIMGAVLFLPWLAFPFLIREIHRRFDLPRSLTLPLVWTAVEWFRATYSYFDFYGLGYSLARITPLVQFADITGVYGVSFLVAAVNGLLADAYLAWREGGAGWLREWRVPRVRRGAYAILGTVALAWVYGTVRLVRLPLQDGPRLAVIQPNIRHTQNNAIGVHLTQMIQTQESVPRGETDLVVWPENAILDNFRRQGAGYLDDLAWLAREKETVILAGGMGKAPDRPGKTTNVAFLVDGTGAVRGEYVKQMLFPWTEHVPADDALERLSPAIWRLHRALIRGAWGFLATGVPGEGTTLLRLPWKGGEIPFGALICLENTYPPYPAQAARMGARFLVNITSEGAVGGVIQEQLLRMSMMRAIENRIAYVRCGNTGISCFIDPKGRLRGLLRDSKGETISVAGTLARPVVLGPPGTTLYARSHDAFAIACLAGTLLLWAGSFLPGSRTVTPIAVSATMWLAAIASMSCGAALTPVGPDEARRALASARLALARGEPGAAIAELERACGDEATCREALPLLAAAWSSGPKSELAAAAFEAIERRHPGLAAEAMAHRGLFLERSSRLVEAERVYERALAAAPTPEVHALLGNLRMRLDKPDEAVASYRRAVALNPKDPQVRYVLARALWLSGSAAEAEPMLEAIVGSDPRFGPAWAVLGRIRLARGDTAGAADAFRFAIHGDPENVEARLALARLALRDGNLEEAKRRLSEILRIEATP